MTLLAADMNGRPELVSRTDALNGRVWVLPLYSNWDGPRGRCSPTSAQFGSRKRIGIRTPRQASVPSGLNELV